MLQVQTTTIARITGENFQIEFEIDRQEIKFAIREKFGVDDKTWKLKHADIITTQELQELREGINQLLKKYNSTEI